jgi:hypothetical protein
MQKFALALVLTAGIAEAKSGYLTAFTDKYTATRNTALDDCSLCHPGGRTSARNQYALDYAAANHSYTAALEARDSDGDGFTNLEETQALTFPGDAASKPAIVAVTSDYDITNVSAPATAALRKAVNVSVTVRNAGTSTGGATLNVTATLSGGRRPKTATLASGVALTAGPGLSQTLTFSWKPSAVGSWTITATVNDTNSDTDTASAVSPVLVQ